MAGPGFVGDVTRSHDYRTFFANSFALQFTGSEFIVRCAILKDATNAKSGVDEQCGLAMSPTAAKGLMLTLKAMIDQIESGGQQIPVSSELTEIIKNIAQTAKSKPPT